MKKAVFYAFLSILTLSTPLLTGCSKKVDASQRLRPDGTPLTEYQVFENEIKDGIFYVRHSDSICEPVYLGEATFDQGSVSKTKNDKRVLWFSSDFDRIPTFYKGDSLIYYTEGVLNEQFTYERFEDFGYSVGIRGLEPTSSGRYQFYTDPNRKCTYPGSDADVVLDIDNPTVIVDSIGDVELRVPDLEKSNEEPVTRCGSIAHLAKDNKYKTKIYEGTIEHDYILTANIRIMASMEGQVSADYTFIGDNKISLSIPSAFNSGYYLINGVGLFRYINGTSYDETFTEMNIPNSIDKNADMAQANGLVKEASEAASEQVSDNTINKEPEKPQEEQELLSDETYSPLVSKFNVTSEGSLSIFITFEDEKGKVITDAGDHIKAVIFSPEDEHFELTPSEDGTFTIEFESIDPGNYVIRYLGLTTETPKVQITAL